MNVAPGVNSVKPANPGTAGDGGGGGGGTKPNTKGQKHGSRNSRDTRDKQNIPESNPAKYGGRTSGGIVGSFSSKSMDIGFSSNATHSEKRARIDNFGEYHEYPPQSIRAIHEEVVMRTLNEVKGSGSVNATAEQSTLYLAEIPGPISITALMGASHVFIRPCKAATVPNEVKAVKGRGLREVVNDENRRIFFIKQTRSTSFLSLLLLWGFFVQFFEFTVIDRNGKPALKISGKEYLFGVHNRASFYYADGTFLAKMKQSLCDGFYRIYDDKSKVIFTIVGPVFACYAPCVFWCCDEDFEILFSGRADEVGRIGKYWEQSEFPHTWDNIGSSFPRGMSLRSKSIIFGACMTIRYQFFINGGNGIILVPIYLLLLGGVAVVLYFNCFSFCNIH